jgi:hypothetical protein
MHEAQIVFIMKVEASGNPTELLQPRKQAFNLLAAFVAVQDSMILRRCFLPVRLMRRDHLNALLPQLTIQWGEVVSFISNQSLWPLTDKTLKESFCDKGDFMRRSTLRADGEWKTRRVCHCHELHAFTALGLTNSPPPFLSDDERPVDEAFTEVISPRVRKSSARDSSTLRNVPSLDHCWNLRW